MLLPPCPGDAQASDVSHAGEDASKTSGLLGLRETGRSFAFLRVNRMNYDKRRKQNETGTPTGADLCTCEVESQWLYHLRELAKEKVSLRGQV